MIYPEPGFPTYAAMIGTAVLPGMAFGAGGEGCLRLCFANSMQNQPSDLSDGDHASLKSHEADRSAP